MKALFEISECGTYAQEKLFKANCSRHHRTREPNAFCEFVEQYQGEVFDLTYALLGDRVPADRAAQRVFASLYRAGRWRNQSGAAVCRSAIGECLKTSMCGGVDGAFSCIIGAAGRDAKRVMFVEGLARLPDKDRILLVLREARLRLKQVM